jgi:hypothetical protein
MDFDAVALLFYPHRLVGKHKLPIFVGVIT